MFQVIVVKGSVELKLAIGDCFEVLATYHRNGHKWYQLMSETGTIKDAPSIYFSER